ncbi:MAG: ATP-dependent helicase [Planctomycetota bacterium]
MPDILDGLTDPQREAVTHVDGPMLVIAGAGSGKTRVVTRRIAWLIAQGVRPWNLLALTFTNKAAGEMAARVEDLVGPARTLITTFHSACARWLRFDIDHLPCGRDKRFTIYDSDDQQALVKHCLKELELDPKRFNPRSILGLISRCKTDMVLPDEARADARGPRQEVAAQVYERYETMLRDANAVDFDDLLWLTLQLLAHDKALLEAYRERYRYVLVDEYQDTNRVQYLLLKALAGGSKNIHATGDPDQSIYSWRGANYRNIMDFENDYPGTRVVLLQENYRSTASILDVSNHLIAHNQHRYEKALFTRTEGGDPVRLAHLPDDRWEAQWIASEIRRLEREGRRLGEIAIFYRTNAQSRPFEEVFMRETLNYGIVGGLRFYERKEIKDLLAYLKAMQNPRDAIAFRRMVGTPPKGVGVKTLDRIEATAAGVGQGMMEFLARSDFAEAYPGRVTGKLKQLRDLCAGLQALPRAPVQALVEQVLDRSGLKTHYKDLDDPRSDERSENIEAFVNRAAEYDQLHPDGDLAAFLEEVALVADVDEWNDDTDRVTLMTIHAAKGLEFPVVFVVGLEEGMLPHRSSMESDHEIEEERRLLYVAMTRAERTLSLSCAAQRLQWGQVSISPPSPFLADLPAEAIDEIAPSAAMPGSAPPGTAPRMAPRGFYGGRRGPVGQGQRRVLGAGQNRRRTFDDLDDGWDLDVDDVDPFPPEDEVQEHPDDDADLPF